MTTVARPFYVRLLRLRHLRLRPAIALLLFEGSVGLGLLLALADIVTPWGVFAVPAAVAVMVKLNDVVTGVLTRPLAVAQLRIPRVLEGGALGRSPVPRPSRLTTEIGADDAVADPDARPDGSLPLARGVASVSSVPGVVRARRPMPRAREPEPAIPVLDAAESTDLEEMDWPVARGVASAGLHVMGPLDEGTDSPNGNGAGYPPANGTPEGAGRRNRGNQGRFAL